jgi:signal transduction histidine kinase/CheY-like chemotaxis protein
MEQQAERQGAERNRVFAEFVGEALQILLVTTLVLAWGWTSFLGLFDSSRVAQGYLLLGITALFSFTAYTLARTYQQVAVAVYLAGLLAAIGIVVSTYGDSSLLMLYLLVVLVAAPLTRPVGLGAATVAVLAAILAMGEGVPLQERVPPVLLTVLTAVTAWLSTRRLFTALEWALNMTEHAQRSAEEARDHRSELQRVLHSLDLALSRLERSNRALAFAQEAAEKAYRFKSEFVANVSHELRTPLNLIVGFSEMMTTAPESYGGSPLPREYRGDMLAIYRSSRHLLDLINDVLDLSQIESGRFVLQKERVDLDVLLQETAEIVRGLAEARHLDLQLERASSACPVDLDRVRIRQVLLNLLTNAMRYTEQGWVRIATVLSETEVTILVQDSGRGIAPEKLNRAFEAFDRLDEEELTHGSGLGLAVSKKFVELHQGRIWIDSVVDKGTTVGFALPRPSTQGLLPLSKVRIPQALHDAKARPLALVLHDDVRALTLLRRQIDSCDFVLAENVGAVQQLLRQSIPDLAIVESSRIAEWKRLAAESEVVDALPLLVTPLPSVHQYGLSLGASDYLPKPVTREDVAYVLARLGCRPHAVLVVDDDPHIVRLIGRMLRSLVPDVHVLEAFEGGEALRIAARQPPDIVFVDLHMPGMGGQQFIEVLRGSPALAAIPVVVVSVRSPEQEIAPIEGELRLCSASGFTLGELLKLIEMALNAIHQVGTMSPANAAARLAALAG